MRSVSAPVAAAFAVLGIALGGGAAGAAVSITFNPAEPVIPTGGSAPVVVNFDFGACPEQSSTAQIFAGHPSTSSFYTLEVVSSSNGVSCNASSDNTSVTCVNPVPLQNYSVTLDVSVPANGAGQGSLAAHLESDCGDTDVEIPVDGVASIGPLLSITRTAGRNLIESFPDSTTIFNHQGFFYSLDVSNGGNVDTTAPVTVTDQVSPQLAIGGVLKLPTQQPIKPYWYLVPFSETTDCGVSPSGLVTCTIPKIPAKKTVRVVIFVEVNSSTAGSISNGASVAGGGDSTGPHSATALTLLTKAAESPFDCLTNSTTGCLYSGAASTIEESGPQADSSSGRFQVRVYWSALRLGTSGIGKFVSLSSDTGYFWFFGPNAVELVVKIVDGRAVNGKFWIFYGALTNVDYILEVVDSDTGRVQGYDNPQEHQASFADTSAFGDSDSTVQADGDFELIPMNFTGASSPASASPLADSRPETVSPCVADSTTLCLKGNRFKVKVAWQALHLGTSGQGNAVPLPTSEGTDTGYFWFFGPNAAELLCKVVDGTAVNGKFWFFYGALSDVQYTITVTDTQTGAVKSYTNAQDHLGSIGDTSAF